MLSERLARSRSIDSPGSVLAGLGLIVIFFGPVPVSHAASPSVSVTLSATEFRGNDTLTMGIQAENPAGNPAADLYVGVLLPEGVTAGVTAVFFVAAAGIVGPIALSDLARFPPFQPAPPGFSLDLPSFLRFTFPAAGFPPGTYRMVAALVRQGALQGGSFGAGDLLALDIKPLTFSPGNVFLPFFQKPFNGEFPLLSPLDHNVPQEFVDANGIMVAWWGSTSFQDGHQGYDFLMPEGTPMLAAADGEVTFAGMPPPFFCPPLNSTVSNVRVTIKHTAPNGEPINSSYVHLSRVDVQVGQRVQAGQQIGLSGNVGCSTLPHLHFEAQRLTNTNSGQTAVIDPFGWEGPGPDPWATHPEGAHSLWLWKAGQVPEIYREVRATPNPLGTTFRVAITAVRFEGWQDRLRPNNEFVEVTLDTRYAPSPFDLTGYRIQNDRGDVYSFPSGFMILGDRPVRVYSGQGPNTVSELFWGLTTEAWAAVDCARLISPSGTRYNFRIRSTACP